MACESITPGPVPANPDVDPSLSARATSEDKIESLWSEWKATLRSLYSLDETQPDIDALNDQIVDKMWSIEREIVSYPGTPLRKAEILLWLIFRRSVNNVACERAIYSEDFHAVENLADSFDPDGRSLLLAIKIIRERRL
jgi:hypothetical protein